MAAKEREGLASKTVEQKGTEETEVLRYLRLLLFYRLVAAMPG